MTRPDHISVYDNRASSEADLPVSGSLRLIDSIYMGVDVDYRVNYGAGIHYIAMSGTPVVDSLLVKDCITRTGGEDTTCQQFETKSQVYILSQAGNHKITVTPCVTMNKSNTRDGRCSNPKTINVSIDKSQVPNSSVVRYSQEANKFQDDLLILTNDIHDSIKKGLCNSNLLKIIN